MKNPTTVYDRRLLAITLMASLLLWPPAAVVDARSAPPPPPAAFDTWEEVGIVCPTHCVCQRAHLRDLSIGRWTSGQQAEEAATTWHLAETRPAHNHNEVSERTGRAFQLNFETQTVRFQVEYGEDGNESGDENPFLKQAMCMLPDKSNAKDVLLSLPPDVQALVLLYNNGADKNVTRMLLHTPRSSAAAVANYRTCSLTKPPPPTPPASLQSTPAICST